jgi:alpha-ribazole phosphatase
MELALIRHPAVAMPPGICYGASNVPLAREPAAEAARLALRLDALGCGAPVCIHTSPLARCAGVAQWLAAHYARETRSDPRLAELDFGAWEMRPWDAIDRAAIDAWARDVEHARPHGGESVAMLAARVAAWLDQLETGGADACAAVVTHAGVIRVLTSLALGLPLAACLDWHLATGAVCRLRRDAGRWRAGTDRTARQARRMDRLAHPAHGATPNIDLNARQPPSFRAGKDSADAEGVLSAVNEACAVSRRRNPLPLRREGCQYGQGAVGIGASRRPSSLVLERRPRTALVLPLPGVHPGRVASPYRMRTQALAAAPFARVLQIAAQLRGAFGQARRAAVD